MKCPLCESSSVELLTERNELPIIQNISFMSEKEARAIEKRDIKLYYCNQCEFAFNGVFQEISYTNQYENNQSYSRKFSKHVQKITRKICKSINALEGRVLIIEIACGQGDFLNDLVSQLSKSVNYQAIGFDPAYRKKDSIQKEHVKFIADYYSNHYLENVDFDVLVIIARHVIAQIPKPLSFFEGFQTVRCSDIRLYIETPDFDWILENIRFEDIVYEYCSFFNAFSLQELLRKTGWDKFYIEKVFEEQYLWIEARRAEFGKTKRIAQYRQMERTFITKWKNKLVEAAENNVCVFIWGAGAKGVVFANLLDPEALYIRAVVDINPNKVGKYLSGSGHKIIGPKDCVVLNPQIIIIMNRNYMSEIKAFIQCEFSGLNQPELICI